jgi:hypothetical protein
VRLSLVALCDRGISTQVYRRQREEGEWLFVGEVEVAENISVNTRKLNLFLFPISFWAIFRKPACTKFCFFYNHSLNSKHGSKG